MAKNNGTLITAVQPTFPLPVIGLPTLGREVPGVKALEGSTGTIPITDCSPPASCAANLALTQPKPKMPLDMSLDIMEQRRVLRREVIGQLKIALLVAVGEVHLRFHIRHMLSSVNVGYVTTVLENTTATRFT